MIALRLAQRNRAAQDWGWRKPAPPRYTARYTSTDGVEKETEFTGPDAAERLKQYVEEWVGLNGVISDTYQYIVSDDGIGKVQVSSMVEGKKQLVNLRELLGKAPLAQVLPQAYVRDLAITALKQFAPLATERAKKESDWNQLGVDILLDYRRPTTGTHPAYGRGDWHTPARPRVGNDAVRLIFDVSQERDTEAKKAPIRAWLSLHYVEPEGQPHDAVVRPIENAEVTFEPAGEADQDLAQLVSFLARYQTELQSVEHDLVNVRTAQYGWRKPVVFEPGVRVLVKEVPEWGEGVIERAIGAPGPDESSRGVDGCATLYSIDFPDGNRLLRSDQLKRAQRKPWDASKHPRGHVGNPGEFSKVSVNQLSKPDELAGGPDRSERARASHFMVDRKIQRYAEQHNEPQVARALGGVSFPDSEAVDIVIAGPTGAVQVGLELKTVVSNKAQKITMKESAMKRKRSWQRKNKARIWTVVLDDTLVYNAKGPGRHDFSKRVIYARKGFGSFRIASMQRVDSMEELKSLLNV